MNIIWYYDASWEAISACPIWHALPTYVVDSNQTFCRVIEIRPSQDLYTMLATDASIWDSFNESQGSYFETGDLLLEPDHVCSYIVYGRIVSKWAFS